MMAQHPPASLRDTPLPGTDARGSCPPAALSKRLSVGLFTYSTRPRGSVVCAVHLAQALHRRGHDVRLYALDKGEGGFYRRVDCPITLIPARPAPPEPDALIAQRLQEVQGYVCRHDVRHDIFHAQDCLVANGLLAALRERGSQNVIVRTLHHVEGYESAYLAACQRRSILDATAVISVSRATQRACQSEFGRESTVIYNGVDKRAQRTGKWEDPFRGFELRRPFLLSVGGVEPRKNSLLQLSAFAQVRRKYPALRWIIVGGQSIWEHKEYRQRFDDACSEFPSGTVHLTGQLSDGQITALYESASALLHAATHEGFALCVLEALAVGTPIVCSTGEPFDEYLDDRCAELVDASDPESIAQGILRALEPSAHSQERLGCRLERADAFDWARAAQAHETFYAQLLSRDAGLAAPLPKE